MIETNKPDFFIVGAAKSGTTSLYHYLNQHPEIYLSPIKEPNFFSSDIKIENLRQSVKNRIKAENIDQFFNDGMKRTIHRAFIRDEHQYLQLFAPAAPGQLKGEASPSYLYSEVAAKSIFAFNEKAKIIIILREPS
ncbi:MAG: sulfotransferase, partial [Bacteroidia bacterium]|nr:sulfotransferase [Bacteroidia bacterium]